MMKYKRMMLWAFIVVTLLLCATAYFYLEIKKEIRWQIVTHGFLYRENYSIVLDSFQLYGPVVCFRILRKDPDRYEHRINFDVYRWQYEYYWSIKSSR